MMEFRSTTSAWLCRIAHISKRAQVRPAGRKAERGLKNGERSQMLLACCRSRVARRL